MPGFIMHLSEAKLIAKHWEKELKGIEKFDYKEWERKFLYGALLPDSVQFPGGKDPKAVSHLWTYSRATHVFMVPDLNTFIERYKDKLMDPVNHPVLVGYLAHLHLDVCYFRDFMPSVVILEDENGEHTNLRNKIKDVYIKKSGKRIPTKELFTAAYLYGDYMRLNTMMIDLYDVKVPAYDPAILKEERIPEVDEGHMEDLLSEMKKYIARSKFDTRQLQIFPEGVVIPFLNTCSDAFMELYKTI